MIIVIKEDGTVLPVGKLNFAPTMKLKFPVFLEHNIVEVSGELLTTNASVTKTVTQGTKYKTKPGATVTDYVATVSKPTTKFVDKTATTSKDVSPWVSTTRHVTQGTQEFSKTVTHVSHASTTTKEKEKTATQYYTKDYKSVTLTKDTTASIWATATKYATNYHTATKGEVTSTKYNTTDKVTATSHPWEATTTKEASFTNTKYYSRTTTKVVTVADATGYACFECDAAGVSTPAYYDITVSDIVGCSANGSDRCDQDSQFGSCQFHSAGAATPYFHVSIMGQQTLEAKAYESDGSNNYVNYLDLGNQTPNACEYSGSIAHDSSSGDCDGSSSTCSVTSSLA